MRMEVEPVRDPDDAYPVATAWRDTLADIARALVRGNYQLRGIPQVAPPAPRTVEQIGSYLARCGETLVGLPAETWESSAAQWMWTHWEVLVDLWTAESGRSDLVISARVFEEPAGYRFVVDSVCVP